MDYTEDRLRSSQKFALCISMHWKRFSHLECGSSKRKAHTSPSLSTTSGVLLTGPPPLKMHERHSEWAADPLRRFSYKAVACAQRSLRSKLSEKLGAVMKCRWERERAAVLEASRENFGHFFAIKTCNGAALFRIQDRTTTAKTDRRGASKVA